MFNWNIFIKYWKRIDSVSKVIILMIQQNWTNNSFKFSWNFFIKGLSELIQQVFKNSWNFDDPIYFFFYSDKTFSKSEMQLVELRLNFF